MKIGYRKPSIKRSISARTTGALKREIKRSINPLYGKKGMGYINNPKKAIYNKIYNQTTSSVFKDTATSGYSFIDDFSSLRVVDLKELCRSRGLKVSGTKQELINRLISSENKPASIDSSAENNSKENMNSEDAFVWFVCIALIFFIVFAVVSCTPNLL